MSTLTTPPLNAIGATTPGPPPRRGRLATALKIDRKQLRQAFRTAVAALVTFAIAEALQLKQGYWAVMTSVLVMQAHLGGSLAASWSRVLGTAVGALLGVVAMLLLGQTMFGLSASVFLCILVCAYLNKAHDSFRLAGLTAVVVLLAGGTGRHDLLLLGLHRFLEISLGVAVTMLVALLVLPSRAGYVLRRRLAQGLNELAGMYDAVFQGYMHGELDAEGVIGFNTRIGQLRETNRRLLAEARRESLSDDDNAWIDLTINYADRVFESIASMRHASENHDAEGFRHILASALTELSAATQASIRALAQNVDATAAKRATPKPADPALDAALAAALERVQVELLELRHSKASHRYRLDEVIHFFSFLLAMQEIGRETLAARQRLLPASDYQS